MSDPVHKITVEIDLDEAVRQRWRSRGFDGEEPAEEPIDLLGLVVQDAAFQLVQDGEVRETKSGLIRRIGQIRDEEIRESVRAQVQAALVEPYQPTDSYGTPRGEPTSLREAIGKEVTATISGLTRQNDMRSDRSLLQKIVHEELSTSFEREIRAALNAAKQEVVRAVHQKGATMLAGTIADMAETVTERRS